MVALLFLTMLPPASAQETTGGIAGYVKDKTGGSVPRATVEVSSPALITPRSAVTDDAGYFRFIQLPPGEYTVTVTAQNFHTYKRSGIILDVGKLPTFEILMEVGAVTETIEVTEKAPIVDVTTSKAAVTIPLDEINNVPKGRSYQSLIPLAPGARQEPLQSGRNDRGRANGFQIDGASDSENIYLVEGLDTTNVLDGGIKQNVVFEFVQEVQIKTSGFEAEYGGAVGGVVNVIQKRGGNEWHGSVLTYYQNNAFDSTDQCAINPFVTEGPNTRVLQAVQCGLRGNPSTSFNSVTRTDQVPEYYHQKQDRYFQLEPGFEVGGPLVKNHLWLFASYIPTVYRLSRTVNFTGKNPGPRTFTTAYDAQNSLTRLDYQPVSRLHLFGSWLYNYSRVTGQLPNTPDSTTGQINSAAGTDPTTIRSDTGAVYPASVYNFGGEWNPSSRVVISARYGYQFYNASDRGRPSGIRYIYQQDLNAATRGLDGNSINSSFFNTTGFSNISSNFQNIFDAFKRKAFSTDLSYSVSKWGTHNFKLGYGFNRIGNEVLQGFNTSQTLIFWATDYTPGTVEGASNCSTIISQNVSTFGSSAAGHCRGNVGHFIVRDGVDITGNVASYNHGLYIQDSWTVGHGLTLNVGVRFDKEFLPPFRVGADSISFGFDQKVAPRIGGAYDVLHNGKLKVFASYGKFFDIMKYGLPRGSFGGDYWHDCVYAMDDPNFNTITPTSPGGHACLTSGPAPGVTVGRFIENLDLRHNVINTADPGVDPNIKPMQQHEFVVGSDWAITSKLGLEIRYARKRLDETIEDIGVTDNFGFYIGNPGSTYSDLLHRALPGSGFAAPICPTCPAQPKATRRYDGLEVRLSQRGTNFFGQIGYTYSKLTGNYAGLTNTDITDGNGGRHSPNNHRDFDHPDMQFTTTGGVQNGPLATDRPHVLGMVGWYRLKWLGMETTFGANQIVASGTPKSTCFATIGPSSSACEFFERRGTFVNLTRDPATGNFVIGSIEHGARHPIFSQTDFNFGHEIKVSKAHEAMRLGFEWTILNLFNHASVLSVSPIPIGATNFVTLRTTSNPTGIDWQTLMTGWDPIKAANAQAYTTTGPLTLNSQYSLPFLFQTRRTMRMKVKFSF